MAQNSTDTLVTVMSPDGMVLYRARQDVCLDYNAYSKSWHNQHGPKVTKSNRRVESWDPNNETKVVATYHRWPSTLKGVGGSSAYIAILKVLDPGMLPVLLGQNVNLDACIAYMFSKGRKAWRTSVKTE